MIWFGLIACAAVERGAVFDDHRQRIPRVGPAGEEAWPMLRGRRAVVTELRLPPQQTWGPSIAAAERYLVVIAGSARLLVDGAEQWIGPGDALLLQPKASLEIETRGDELVLIEMCAGADSTVRWDTWPALSEAGRAEVAVEGPFVITCAEASCQVWHRGEATGEPVWHYGEASDLLRPIPPWIEPADTWLVAGTAGDGCPARYQLLCLFGGVPRWSAAFGNCEPPRSIEDADGAIRLHFRGYDLGVIARADITVLADRSTCTVTEVR